MSKNCTRNLLKNSSKKLAKIGEKTQRIYGITIKLLLNLLH